MKESFCWSTGKMRHVSLAVAHHALAIRDQGGMHAYHCQDCGGWHVGHGGKRGRHLDPTQRPLGPRLSGNRRLRRKLGRDAIRTVRGVGYQWGVAGDGNAGA